MTKKKNVNKPTAPAKVEASTSVSEGKLPSNEAAAPNDELQSSEILQDAVALVAEHNKETDENKLRYVHQDQLAHKNFTLHETVELAPQARAQKALQIAHFSMERGFIGLSDCAPKYHDLPCPKLELTAGAVRSRAHSSHQLFPS